MPEPFEVARRALTSHPVAVERRAQDLLADYRVRTGREFFRTTPEVAFDAVQRALLEKSGIQAWNTDEPVRLRDGDRLALTLRAGQILVVVPYGPLADGHGPIDVWQAHANGDLLELMAVDSPEGTTGFSTADAGAETDPVPYLNRTRDAANGTIIGNERMEPGQRLLWLDGTVIQPACAIAMFELDAYCQIVCRTWTPRRDATGFPLLLNATTEQPTECMVAVVRGALQMKPPELSQIPPQRRENDPVFGSVVRDPAYWLSQLQVPPRRRRRDRGT